jgi:hypothetical protein
MMRERLKTIAVPAAALFAGIALAAMSAPEASAGEFCRMDVTGHMTSCSFDNMAQCRATSAGIGGDCFRDPFLGYNGNASAYHPTSSSSMSGRRSVGMSSNLSR